MTLFIPESTDTFGWVCLIIVAVYSLVLILLECLRTPLSYGKDTDEGCSSKFPICNSQYNYRSSFAFIYGLPIITFPITSFITILSNNEIRDSELSTNNTLYFIISLCMVMIYFIKRALETCFIHIYSNETLPLSTTLFMIIMFNISFIGIAHSICCVIINHISYNNHMLFIIIGLIIFIPSIIWNGISHYQLRQLRVTNMSKNYISLNQLPRIFQIFVCPHYIAEILTFIALVITIRTCIMLLFFIAVFIGLISKTRRNKQFYNTMNNENNTNSQIQLNNKLPLPGQCLIKCTGNLQKDLSTLKQRFGKYEELMDREMIETKNNDIDSDYDIESNSITVMQFNLLADGLCCAYSDKQTEKTFLNVDYECLQWTYRGIRLAEEMLRFKPDIIGVEECDQLSFLMKYMKSNGYKSCFQIKNSSPINRIAKELSEERNEKINMDLDGVALIYNANKFKICGKIQQIDCDNDAKIFGLAVPLKINKINKEILVVVTHLKSKKTEEGEEIREKQINLLLNELIKNENNLPIILCCDLNANPIQNKKGYDPLCYNSITN
eukprot:459166_1